MRTMLVVTLALLLTACSGPSRVAKNVTQDGPKPAGRAFVVMEGTAYLVDGDQAKTLPTPEHANYDAEQIFVSVIEGAGVVFGDDTYSAVGLGEELHTDMFLAGKPTTLTSPDGKRKAKAPQTSVVSWAAGGSAYAVSTPTGWEDYVRSSVVWTGAQQWKVPIDEDAPDLEQVTLSPNGTRVAWSATNMEWEEDAEPDLRIATVGGTGFTSVQKAEHVESPKNLIPVAWLDDEWLLVARVGYSHQAVRISNAGKISARVDIDGLPDDCCATGATVPG